MANQLNFENLQLYRTVNVFKHAGTYQKHWHKHVEIMALPFSANESASHVVSINDEVYKLSPGDIVFVWTGELHAVLEDSDSSIVGMQFSSTLFNELPDFAPYIHIFRSIHYLDSKKTTETNVEIFDYIDQVFSVQAKQNSFVGVESLICLYELFMCFGRYVQKECNNELDTVLSGASRTDLKIKEVCNYIEENCDKDLSLDYISSYIGFSSYYFSRIFKKCTGYSYIEYITQQRVRRAQLLLADSDKYITEISYLCGFKSISTFNRVFRQYRGCSPSQFRKYYLNY